MEDIFEPFGCISGLRDESEGIFLSMVSDESKEDRETKLLSGRYLKDERFAESWISYL